MLKLISIIILLTCFTPAMAEHLTITDAWIKNLPPVIPMRAGYMKIRNSQDADLTILAVTSDAFEKIEIHQTMQKDGMMNMQKQQHLTIAAGASEFLQPGSLHLMMMNPAKQLKPGDEVKVQLHPDNSTSQTINMVVKK